MPLSAIRTIICEVVDGTKFEKIIGESGFISYAVNNATVERSVFEEHLFAAYKRSREEKDLPDSSVN